MAGSWRRRGLINIFWITWFLIVGYRTPLIMGHCIIGYTRQRKRRSDGRASRHCSPGPRRAAPAQSPGAP